MERSGWHDCGGTSRPGKSGAKSWQQARFGIGPSCGGGSSPKNESQNRWWQLGFQASAPHWDLEHWTGRSAGEEGYTEKHTGSKYGSDKGREYDKRLDVGPGSQNVTRKICVLTPDCEEWSDGASGLDVEFVRVVASYSWVGSPECSPPPQVIIPGMPGCYQGLTKNNCIRQMEKDGLILKDENHFRLSSASGGCFPTEPIFVALDTCATMLPSQTIGVHDVDLICDSNTLCKLLSFLRGNSSRVTVSQRNHDANVTAPFEFDLDLIAGKTVLLTRVEENDVMSREPSVFTFGRSFERLVAPLPDDLSDCYSFYRIALVRIGGLRALVRTQVDAVDGPGPEAIGDEKLEWEHVPHSLLEWKHGGSAQCALHTDALEMKTISSKAAAKHWSWDEWYAQMLFRGAPKLVLGFHKDGLITREPTEIPMGDVEKKAHNTREVLPRLESLLRKLMDLAGKNGHITARCDGRTGASLQVLKKAGARSRVPPWLLGLGSSLTVASGPNEQHGFCGAACRSTMRTSTDP